jgi:Fic family protein
MSYILPVLTKKEKSAFLPDIFQKISYWNQIVSSCNSPEYLSWKTLQYKAPFVSQKKKGYSALSFLRKINGEKTPIKVKNSFEYFTWNKLSRYEQYFFAFEKKYGGDQKITENLLNQRILRGIEEEAIASSQMEGACTTRKVAKDLLKSKKAPKNPSEKMIVNNYLTILWIEQEAKNQPMSEHLLKEIQKKITENTLENTFDEGRFREDSDEIVVSDEKNEILHTPCKKNELDTELKKFCAFANNEPINEEEEFFLFPCAKALFLHFWLAYLHPFCDGNGRTARAIFYWYLLRNGYSTIGLLPISTELKNTQSQYGKAFLFSEQEGNDLTFFIDYMVKIMKRAEKSLKEYGEKIKIREETIVKKEFSADVNKRQIELLLYFQANPSDYTDYYRHQLLQGISLPVSRNDILDLEQKGFLSSKKKGKRLVFFPCMKAIEEFFQS